MNKQTFLSAVVFAVLIPSAYANKANPGNPGNGESRRATIVGGSGPNGKCTVEVSVDDGAEVEVSGDNGLLRTTSGQPAAWRRFQCTAPLPRNAGDFRFTPVRGRGSMRLIGEPRSNRGRAVVHIDDPKAGRGIYVFDLEWRGPGGIGWMPGPPPPPAGGGWGPGRFPMARAIRICQDSVTDRLIRDGYQDVAFQNTHPDSDPGRNDWVLGTATGRRYYGTTVFSFSCSVDFSTGRVRSVDVSRR